MMKKIKAFFSLDVSTKILFLEAIFTLGWARFLKNISFSKAAKKLGEQMKETSWTYQESNKKELRRISQAVQIMSRYTPWESKCLVRAIAAMKMLERRQIESTIYLGTGKDEHGKMIAHAWLRSGPIYLTGAEEMHRFVVVNKFAKSIKGESHGKKDQTKFR